MPTTTGDEYVRRARVVRVVDGDTVDVDVDLGMSITTRQRLRLLGINAPESRGPSRVEGKAATRHLESLLIDYADEHGDREIVIKTHKGKGKFGRYLAVLYGIAPGSELVDLNARMVQDGHAIVANY